MAGASEASVLGFPLKSFPKFLTGFVTACRNVSRNDSWTCRAPI
jgi:hypothetical protein